MKDQLALMLLTWLGTVVTVVGITIGIARFGTVTGSVWEPAAGIAPWFVAFMCGYVLHTTLPLHIAHGRTRRDFAVEAAIFGGIYALAGALLITVGYLLERGFYAIGDWPLDFSNDHLFSSHTEVALIFAEYLLRFLVWAAAGAFTGAAIYRYGGSGYLALLPASLLVGLMGVFLDDYWGPAAFAFERLPAADSPSLPIATVIAAICVLAAFAMTWRIVRDMPVRNT